MNNFTVEIKVVDDDKFYPNSIVLATQEEAEAYGRSKVASWIMADKYRVVPSDKPVNYRWEPGAGLVSVTSEAA